MRGSSKKVVLVLALFFLAALAPLFGPDATPSERTFGDLPSVPFTEASTDTPGITYTAHVAGSAEVAGLMGLLGVREEGRSYNVVYDGLGTGLAPPTMDQYASMVGSLRVFDSVSLGQGVSLPSTVDHSKEKQFPMVDSQGGQGSCAAWACSYYTNGYLQSKDMGWNDTSAGNKSHLMSPAWVYNKINGGYDSGSSWFDNTALMMDLGNADMASQVYHDYDLHNWGNESAWRSAPQYRIQDQCDYGDPSDTNLIKAWIAEGYVCPIALNAGNYAYIGSDGILTAAEHQGGYANHANTIVGYNDSIVAGNDVGAFRVVNSWGKGWGSGGYYWMTYDAVAELNWYVLRMHDRVDYEPQLLATWNQSVPGSKDSRFYIGTASGLYTSFEPYCDGGSSTKMPAFMCMDATTFVGERGLSKFFLYFGAGVTVGTVSAFTMEYYPDGYTVGKPVARAVSTDAPKRATATLYAAWDGVHISLSSPAADSWHRGNVTFAGNASARVPHPVLNEGFEGPWTTVWTKEDSNATSGVDTWGLSTARTDGGFKSIWCAGSDGSTVYYEDFNDGGALPSGWKATSDGPNQYPFAAKNAGYRGCGGSDYLAVADSNRGAGTNVTERLYMTAPFDASNWRNLQLRSYIDYDYSNGNEWATVMFANASTYPTFTNLTTYTTDAFGIKTFNLSSQDGEGELYIGFLYHGTADRYMCVDDVRVVGDKATYDPDMVANVYASVGNLKAYDNVTLDYHYWIDSERSVDVLSAMYRTSAGSPWVLVTNHSGQGNGWEEVSVEVPVNATSVGFRFTSNSTVVGEGAYIDDVNVTAWHKLDGIEMKVDGGAWQPAASAANWTAVWNSTGATDGAHALTFRALYGSEWDFASIRVSTDNTPPRVGAVRNTELTTGDPAELDVTATDLNEMRLPVLHYVFTGHDGLMSNATTNGTGAWKLTLVAPADATSLDYRFWLEDVLGNGVFTDLATAPVRDNDAPALDADLTPLEATTGDPLAFNASVIDNIGVLQTQVEYWYGDGGHQDLTLDGGAFLSTITVLDTLEPIHYFISAVDASGNRLTGPVRTVPVRDNDSPTFGADATPATADTGGTVTLSVGVSDNIAVGGVLAQFWFGATVPSELAMVPVGDGTYTLTIGIPLTSIAPLHYYVRSNDTSGNWNETLVRDVRVLDDVLPELAGDATPGTATTGDPFRFAVNVTDNIAVGTVWVEYWYGAGAHANATASTTDGSTWALTVTALDTLEPLRYVLHVNDTSGNSNLSLEREVSVLDNDPPAFVSDASPAWVPTGTTYRFDVTVRDNIGVGSVLVWYWFDDQPHRSQPMTGEDLTGRSNGTYAFTVVTPSNSTAELRYYFESSDIVGNWARTPERVVEVRDITPPVAAAGRDVVIDQHQRVDFDGRASSDNVGVAAWTWEVVYGGEKALVYGAAPSFLFDDAGTYTVTLTVRDPSGNTGTDAMTVTVNDITSPVADAGGDQIIDQGQTARFTAEGSTDNVGIIGWEWSFVYGGTPVKLDGSNGSYTFSTPGTYTVTLTVTDAAGNSGNATVRLKVNDIVKPTVVAKVVSRAKKGQSVTLDGSSSTDNVGIVNWTWRVRLQGESTWREVYGERPSFAFDRPGDHAVQLVVRDADGNVATSQRFTVHVPNTMLWMTMIVIIAAAVVLIAVAASRRRRRE